MMKALFPESTEERCKRAADLARRMALAREAQIESITQPMMPPQDTLATSMAARIRAAAPQMKPYAVVGAASALAKLGHDTAVKLAHDELRHEDLSDSEISSLEAVISVIDRPAWFVENNLPNTTSFEASGLWITLATQCESKMLHVCRAVGCIMHERDGVRQPIGTGWLTGSRTLVTNAHVGMLLAYRKPGVPVDDPRNGYRLRHDVTGTVNFFFEHVDRAPIEVTIDEVLFVEPSQDPDIAVFRLVEAPALAERKITLDLTARSDWPNTNVFTVGHPVRDLQDDRNVEIVFGPLDGTKRLSPGKIIQVLGGNTLAHDCSTTNGSSGSPLIDFGSYHAVGLHYFGKPGERNEAVLFTSIKNHALIARSLALEWSV